MISSDRNFLENFAVVPLNRLHTLFDLDISNVRVAASKLYRSGGRVKKSVIECIEFGV